MIGIALGLLCLLSQVRALFGLRTFGDLTNGQWDCPLDSTPPITVIVPARNEQEKIGSCLLALLALDYPDLQIIAVDDRSTDATGDIMDRLCQQHPQCLSVIHVDLLPSGWLGKTHAMWLAAEQARGEWLIFTDGDVIFRPDTLRRVVNYLRHSHADHLVIFPTAETHSVGEKLMLSFFPTAMVLGMPAWKVADPRSRSHVGAGAFNMISRHAYQRIGTFKALRLAVVEDLRLGWLVKRNGFSQRLALGPGLVSLHWVKGGMGIVRNMGKNAFALVHYRWPLALLLGFGALLVNVAPFAGLIVAPGLSRAGYALAVVAIFLVYVLLRPFSGISPIYFISHPIAASLSVYALFRSAWMAIRQGGIIWRGTLYPLADLRRFTDDK
jgi:glycosyltransferase involved in cell wall biosynthesis